MLLSPPPSVIHLYDTTNDDFNIAVCVISRVWHHCVILVGFPTSSCPSVLKGLWKKQILPSLRMYSMKKKNRAKEMEAKSNARWIRERKFRLSVCSFVYRELGKYFPSQVHIDGTDQKEMRGQAPQLPGGSVPERAASTQTLCWGRR